MPNKIYRGHDLIPCDDTKPGSADHIAIYHGKVFVGIALTEDAAMNLVDRVKRTASKGGA